jgi:cytochrome c biogenesis protein CcmG, thiol:disulfide interchange protein DsbE
VALCFVLILPLAFAIEAGQPAPDFTLPGADGRPLQLAGLRGKLVYLDFWASWCAPCRRSFPWMNVMQEKYGPGGLVVLGINVDQRRPDADRFLAQVPAKFAIAYDPQGTAPKLYAIKGMPSSVLIDAQGRVLLAHAGFRDDERDELEARIRAALPPRAN